MLAAEKSNTSILAKIESSLDSIRPYLKADGGDVEVVELTADNVLKVKLLGACECCPMSLTTMRAGIQETIKRDIPGITGVVAVS